MYESDSKAEEVEEIDEEKEQKSNEVQEKLLLLLNKTKISRLQKTLKEPLLKKGH